MRFLLDENLEHEIFHRLENGGHDVLHVEVSEGLSKGDSDTELGACSRQDERVIVTYDDDFLTELSEEAYYAVLYFPDQSLSAREVAEVLEEISTYYDEEQLRGVQTVGRSWLD
jgi:predicted nuclease of predicted toxin-antitoxin system